MYHLQKWFSIPKLARWNAVEQILELISRSDVARAIEKTTNVAEINGRIHEASRLSDASL